MGGLSSVGSAPGGTSARRVHLESEPFTRLRGFDFALVAAWILSFTIGRDLVAQLKLYDVLAAIAIARNLGLLLEALSRPAGLQRSARWLLLAYSVGTVVAMVRGLGAIPPSVLMLRLYRGFAFVAVFLILQQLRLDRVTLHRLLLVFFGSVLTQASLIVAQSFGLIGSLWPQNEMVYGRFIPTGTLGMNHVNSVLFMTLGVSVAIAIYGVKREGKWWKHAFVAGSASLMIYAMLLGEARTALFSLPALGLFSLRFKEGRVVLLSIALLGVALQGRESLSYVDEYGQLWANEIVSKSQGDSLPGVGLLDDRRNSRLQFWKDAIDALLDRPDLVVTGAGYQNFVELGARAIAAHNIFLQYLGELGLLGLFAFVTFLVQLVRVLRRRLKRTGASSAVAGPAFGFLVGVIVVGTVNDSLYPTRFTFGWMGFCMAFLAVVTHPGWVGPRPARAVGGRAAEFRRDSRPERDRRACASGRPGDRAAVEQGATDPLGPGMRGERTV